MSGQSNQEQPDNQEDVEDPRCADCYQILTRDEHEVGNICDDCWNECEDNEEES